MSPNWGAGHLRSMMKSGHSCVAHAIGANASPPTHGGRDDSLIGSGRHLTDEHGAHDAATVDGADRRE
jgi:hypothetical protein